MVADDIFTLEFSSEKMLGRRGKSFLPTLGVIGLLLLSIYGYYVYYQLKEKCGKTDNKLSYLVKRQVSLKSQLQVVYEHRSKLEAALLKQRTIHKATKHAFSHEQIRTDHDNDFATKMVECAANLTRAKQQAMNRFNALDTEHRMQKARHEEIVTDFDRLTQQYVRLTKDHQQIVTGHKEDYQKLKDAKEQESKSLRERVESLHNESQETLAEKRKYFGFYHSERTERLRLETANTKMQNSMDKLKIELSSLKKDKLESQAMIEKAEEQIEDLEKKIQELTRKSRNDVVANKKKSTDIVKATKKSQGYKAISATAAAQVASTIPPTQKTKDRSLDIGTADKSTPQRKALVIKPSDKVQGILLGKKDVDPEAMHSKKEDSIKDEYEVTETSERGNPKMVTEAKTEPPGEDLVEQEPGDEVNFQHLVKSGIVLDGGKGNSGPNGAKGVERDAMTSERAVDTNLAGNYEREEKKAKRGLKKGLMKALITTNAEKEKESLKREIPRNPSELDALKKKAVLGAKSEDEGASFLRRQQQLLHRPIAKVQEVEADKAETEIEKKIPEPNESEDAIVENPEKDDETIKVSDVKETEEIKHAKELGEEEIKAKKNNEDEQTEGLEDHNDIETEAFDSKNQNPKSFEETKGVGEDEKEVAEKNNEEKNDKGIDPKNSNWEKDNDVDKAKEVPANTRNEKINHIINKELKSVEEKENEEKKMLKKDEEGTKNEGNLARDQIRPPNVLAKGDGGTANEKPAKQRRQLRPPLGRRKSNNDKHNKAEVTKRNIELDDGKTGNVDKNEGKQLHAPIKPQRKRRAEEGTNDAEKPPKTEKEKDANEAQSHNEDKAAGQPTSHMTLEDDENGDQDLDEQDPGIAEREDDGKTRGFDEEN